MNGFVVERIESRQRRLAELPYCCRDAVVEATGIADSTLLVGVECSTCAARWLNIAPRMWVMETELMLASTKQPSERSE